MTLRHRVHPKSIQFPYACSHILDPSLVRIHVMVLELSQYRKAGWTDRQPENIMSPAPPPPQAYKYAHVVQANHNYIML